MADRISLSELFDIDELSLRIERGYVSMQTHPTLPLSILNYAPSCQYERAWDEITTQCRGLIYNSMTGTIIARPFPKFFNYGETDQYDDLPDGTPTVSEKLDGSLGIIYSPPDGSWDCVATRGSFTSDQALWATEWLHDNYPNFAQPTGVTTLVEIVFHENRIVVDYEDEGLILIGAIDNATGADIPVGEVAYDDGAYWTGPVAEHFEYTSLEDSVAMATGDDFVDGEGVVLCWSYPDRPSFRLKVKHPRYVELHRIVTGLSTRTVHEALANGTFHDLIANVPDEFHPWLEEVAGDLVGQFEGIVMRAQADLDDARWCALHPVNGNYLRKDLAYEITKNALNSGLCFALEDGKDIAPRVWDMIKPARSLAMILEDDEE